MAVMFTRDEFHQMIKEVHSNPITRSETLAHIVEVTVRAKINYLCSINPSIRGLKIEDDAFQETYLRVCSKLFTDFLYRADKSGLNDDHEGFAAWLLAVASSTLSNVAADTLYREDTKKQRSEQKFEETDYFEEAERKKEDIEQLERAIDLVVGGKFAIYKVLSWLGMATLMLASDENKIYSTHKLVERGAYSLNVIYNTIRCETNYVPWLKVDGERDAKIRKALEREYKDGVSFGETPFETFFMKGRDGKPDGLKSVADWVCHINKYLEKELKHER